MTWRTRSCEEHCILHSQSSEILSRTQTKSYLSCALNNDEFIERMPGTSGSSSDVGRGGNIFVIFRSIFSEGTAELLAEAASAVDVR